MKIFESSFKFHVDAKYCGFQWASIDYITTEYSAIIDGDSVRNIVIMKLSAPPYVFGSIAIHSNWMEMSREMEAAAKDHAIKELSGMDSNVHPTIMKAIPPQAQAGELIESLSNINEHFKSALANHLKKY